ncbi:hypothetical protein D3C86_1889560 [compost metagenome]
MGFKDILVQKRRLMGNAVLDKQRAVIRVSRINVSLLAFIVHDDAASYGPPPASFSVGLGHLLEYRLINEPITGMQVNNQAAASQFNSLVHCISNTIIRFGYRNDFSSRVFSAYAINDFHGFIG